MLRVLDYHDQDCSPQILIQCSLGLSFYQCTDDTFKLLLLQIFCPRARLHGDSKGKPLATVYEMFVGVFSWYFTFLSVCLHILRQSYVFTLNPINVFAIHCKLQFKWAFKNFRYCWSIAWLWGNADVIVTLGLGISRFQKRCDWIPFWANCSYNKCIQLFILQNDQQ